LFGVTGGRVERGGAHVWGLLNNILGQDILINTITLMAVLVAALWSYPPFWWIFIVPIPIHLLSTHLFTAMYNRKAELLSSLTDGASRTLYDGLANVKAVKTFGRDWGEAARYAGRWSGPSILFRGSSEK
jgi:ABC-type multidrug transport system fused ATPase/permease subunit